MTMFDLYRTRMSVMGRTEGQAKINDSAKIMNATWFSDTQARVCYLYDYFHDGEPDKNRDLDSPNDCLKIPIDAKFIVSQYQSLSKDQVEYHLQFRPGAKNPLPYDWAYKEEYPVGLYVDIPDVNGVYNRWIILGASLEPQFVKYTILPANYLFRWCRNGKTYAMWGIARLRNSYNSGIWTDYYATTIENQDVAWFPQNQISEMLYYDSRLIVSVPLDKPITWKVTKVETIHPIGIYKLTLGQDKFNPHTDYVNRETGVMIADYYTDNSPEHDPIDPPITNGYSVISYTGKSSVLKVRGSNKKFSAKFFDDAGAEVSGLTPTWVVLDSEGVVIDDPTVVVKNNDDGSIYIKVTDDKWMNKTIRIRVMVDGQEQYTSEIVVEVSGL